MSGTAKRSLGKTGNLIIAQVNINNFFSQYDNTCRYISEMCILGIRTHHTNTKKTKRTSILQCSSELFPSRGTDTYTHTQKDYFWNNEISQVNFHFPSVDYCWAWKWNEKSFDWNLLSEI